MSAEAIKVSSVLDTSHLKVKFPYKAKYGNYINGKFVEPLSGKYFDNTSPISNEVICSVARSNEKDVDAALDAAHAAACAASNAASTSFSLDRATEQITSFEIGEVLSKYFPDKGSTNLPFI